MKRIIFLLFPLAIFFSGCCQEELENSRPDFPNGRIFTASFDQNETRTYIEDGNLLRWNEGDQISLFDGNTLNRQYQFDGETGDNAGTFSLVSKPYGTGNDLTANYAVYPYASNLKITEAGILSVTLPAEQNYAENSFGLGANTMVAATKDTDDTFLKFKNVCGYLKLQLYGDDITIKSITLAGNCNEKLAGKTTITPAYGQDPTTTMSDDATASITLDCGDGVNIGATAETATAFWVVVPPTTFEEGFEIIITDLSGDVFKKSTYKEVVIERNMIKPMTAFEVTKSKPTNNEIWYTNLSTTEATAPQNANSFGGAKIQSNLYNAEKECWIITSDKSVTEIGSFAFENCSNITNITLPASVTEIDWGAFKGCTGLTNINIPNNVNTIGYEAFKNCSSLSTLIIGNRVTLIDAEAFASCTELKSVDIPNSVTTIGDDAFKYCISLTSLTLGSGVTSIGSWAFEDCFSLTSLNIPDSVISIGASAFNDCNKITSVNIGKGVVSIGNLAFAYCNSLENINIPDNVTEIGRYAFAYCDNLKSVNFGANVKSLQLGIFEKCSNLINVTLPERLTKIESNAFYYCKSLTGISVPQSVTTIQSAAFYGCANLASMTLPGNLTELGNSVFYGCTSLTSIVIPDSIKWIRDYAFARCSSLIDVTLSNSVLAIKPHAFESCHALATITIPDTAAEIGEMAFYDCINLKTVYCKPILPPTGGRYMFSYAGYSTYEPIDCNIYVPCESIDAYKTAKYWNNLNIVGIEEETDPFLWFNPDQYITYVENYEVVEPNAEDWYEYSSSIDCPISPFSKIELKYEMIDDGSICYLCCRNRARENTSAIFLGKSGLVITDEDEDEIREYSYS